MPRPDAFTGPGPPPNPGGESRQRSLTRESHVTMLSRDNLVVDLPPSARVMRSKIPLQTQSRIQISDSRTNSPYSIKSTSVSTSRCSSVVGLFIGNKIPITPRKSNSGHSSRRNSNMTTPILLQTQSTEGDFSLTSCSRELTPSYEMKRLISSDMDSSSASTERSSKLPVATGAYGTKSTPVSTFRCSSALRLYIGNRIPITPRMSRSGRASGRNSHIPTPILLHIQTEEGNVSPPSWSRESTPSVEVERQNSAGIDSPRASTVRSSRLPVATGNRPKTARLRRQKPLSPVATKSGTTIRRQGEETKIPVLVKKVTNSKTNFVESKTPNVENTTQPNVDIVDSNMEFTEAIEPVEEAKIPDEETEVSVENPMLNNQQRPPARRGPNIGSYGNIRRQNALTLHQLLP